MCVKPVLEGLIRVLVCLKHQLRSFGCFMAAYSMHGCDARGFENGVSDGRGEGGWAGNIDADYILSMG